MNEENAFKFAYELLNKELKTGISEARESNDYWIFFAGNNRMIGRPGIAINKTTNEFFFLQMPSEKTMIVLEGAKNITVPTKYYEQGE